MQTVAPHLTRVAIPPMTDTYKARNRSVASIMFREWLKEQSLASKA